MNLPTHWIECDGFEADKDLVTTDLGRDWLCLSQPQKWHKVWVLNLSKNIAISGLELNLLIPWSPFHIIDDFIYAINTLNWVHLYMLWITIRHHGGSNANDRLWHSSDLGCGNRLPSFSNINSTDVCIWNALSSMNSILTRGHFTRSCNSWLNGNWFHFGPYPFLLLHWMWCDFPPIKQAVTFWLLFSPCHTYISKTTFLGDSTLDGGWLGNARHVAGHIWDQPKIIIFEWPRNQ
jgi:hypothetical protein